MFKIFINLKYQYMFKIKLHTNENHAFLILKLILANVRIQNHLFITVPKTPYTLYSSHQPNLEFDNIYNEEKINIKYNIHHAQLSCTMIEN